MNERQIVKTVTIKHELNAFSSAYLNAEKLLKSEGFTVGVMCGDSPIGFASETKCKRIEKWRNISDDDRLLLDGIMTSDNWVNCDVTITYYK